MELLFNKLNRLRVFRNLLYLLTFLFSIVVLLINHYFVKTDWLYALILFDDLLIFVILIFLIEGNIGYRYNVLYHEEFLPRLFKEINLQYKYKYKSHLFEGDLQNSKIYDSDSDIHLRHRVDMKSCLFYDAEIYINTFRSRKITLFNGYIYVFPEIKNDIMKGLILYHKKLCLGHYKLLKDESFSHYKLYGDKLDIINKEKLNQMKSILNKNSHLRFNVCMQDKITIFQKNRLSFFRKPIMRSIDQVFFKRKIAEFKKIQNIMEEFLFCLKDDIIK